MIISENIGIHRIISGTWKHFAVTVLLCTATYMIHKFLIPENFSVPVLMPTVLGTALAFFIGFNNNQAYDRWWEARKIWGTLVNDSRTWARQMLYFPDQASDKEEIQQIIKTAVYRHISLLYALKQSLRKSDDDTYQKYISEEDRAFVASQSDKAVALLTLQTADLNRLYAANRIDGFKFLELNKMLISFCDQTGKAERIANTVFPTTYNFYTRIFIWLFIFFITLVSAQGIEAWSILSGTLIGYVFLTIDKIGRSLLNPFDAIATGIPLDQITRTAEINMLETLKESDIPAPAESVNGEYIM